MIITEREVFHGFSFLFPVTMALILPKDRAPGLAKSILTSNLFLQYADIMFREPELKNKIIDAWRVCEKRFPEPKLDWWSNKNTITAPSVTRTDPVMVFLRERGLLKPDQHVIDIGCGRGERVGIFAESAGQVTGLDISPYACTVAQEHIRSLHLDNVNIINADFHTFDPVEEGTVRQYDLVFAYNAPVLGCYDSFRKIEIMSKNACFTSNVLEVKHRFLQEAAVQVIGKRARTVHKNQTFLISAFALLSMEGRRPEVTYYEETIYSRISAREKVPSILKKSCREDPVTEDEQMQILELLKDRIDENGTYVEEIHMLSGWLFWKMNL